MKLTNLSSVMTLIFLVSGINTAASADDPPSKAAAASPTAVPEEIVVTARKRNESLQDIPLAISAFSARDIQDAGIQDLGDIASQTAGLTFNPRGSIGRAAGRADSVINMRGVTGGTAQGNLDHLQPTSLFIDGIYVLGTASSVGLNDVERVEVIKGPQSAFFGRNTFAGAINYITKTPDLYEYKSQIDVSLATYDKFDGYLMNSGPLVEGKLAYQVNASLYSRGSEWEATDGGELGEESSSYVSAVLYGEPIEKLTFKVRASYQRDDDGPAVSGLIRGRFADSCTGTSVERYNNAGTAKQSYAPHDYICGRIPGPGFNEPGKTLLSRNTSLQPVILYQDRQGAVVTTGEVLLGPQPNAIKQYLAGSNASQFLGKSVPDIDDYGMLRTQTRLSLNTDYDFDNGYSANFLAGWNEMKMSFLRDYDETDEEYWYANTPKYGKDWSIESRLLSPQDSRFRWLAGATYYEQDFITSTNGLLITTCYFSCAAGPAILSTPAINGNSAKAWAVYGSVSFDILDNLTLDIEARYIEDERTASDSGATFVNTFKDTAPRIILSYRPTEDATLYAQVSKGTLPGYTNGVVGTCSPDDFLVPYNSPITNQPSTASECTQLQSQLAPGQFKTVTPSQELNAFEIGLKQTLADGRLNLNIAAWFYEWKNSPFGAGAIYYKDAANPASRDGIPLPSPTSVLIQAPGQKNLWGVEVESNFAITDNWSTQFNVAWTDTEIKELSDNTMAQLIGFSNLKGLEAKGAPEWQGNLSTTYKAPFVKEWDWYTRGDFTYQGSYWADNANLAKTDSYFLTHARVGLQREDLRVEFFVRNLFDEDNWAAASQRNDFTQPTFNLNGYHGISVIPQEKRTFGIRMNMSF